MRKEIQDTIKVEYHLGDTDDILEMKCKNILNSKCGSYGYIITDTFEMVSRSPPVLTNMENGGKLYTIIKFQATAVTLQKGEIIQAKIIKITPKLGASAVIIIDGVNVADIILPNDMQPPGLKIKEGEFVDIRIMISSYGVGWERIRGVGICVSNIQDITTESGVSGLNQSELQNIRIVKNAKGNKVHIT